MLTARADGQVEAATAVLLPIMAPRLQGQWHGHGILDLALWGAGGLGRVRHSPLEGPFLFAPNKAEGGAGGVHVAQSAPVMVICGASLSGLYPARRPASWDRSVHKRPPVQRQGARTWIGQPWGILMVESRGPDLVVAVGVDLAEIERGLSLGVAEIKAQALAYVLACDQMPNADPVLRTMVSQGVHAMQSSLRRDQYGGFLGLAAGLAYSTPARTYFRDGYWTLQGLLGSNPQVVEAEIDCLAHGIRVDGEAPSGVIVSGPDEARLWTARLDPDHSHPRDWWSDHFDSPLFFVLMLGDYTSATGKLDVARRQWAKVRAIFRRYQDASVLGLPAKPRNDRDWADNVYRSGHVSYDIGLWIGALDVMVRLGRVLDEELASQAEAQARSARAAVTRVLFGSDGRLVDYAPQTGPAENHLCLDSLTLVRYRALDNEKELAVLAAMAGQLETRSNSDQPYGDWGMMCAWPPFRYRRDVRSKTAFAYRYHNGSDWPWLDGLYSEARLDRGLPGWRYPLVRWWEVCLARGWLGAVEYFSPPWGRGSLLQGWSGFPAAVALRHAGLVLAGDPQDRPA